MSLQANSARDHDWVPNSTVQVVADRPQQTIRLVKGNLNTDLAGHLPFDFLSQIFEEYILQETPTYPVETLLLVCRSWSQAVLDHTRLWSTFTMYFEDFNFWDDRIEHRLRWCPSDSLLDIEIRSRAYQFVSGQTIESVFRTLVGLKGCRALRWRKFKVNDEHNHSYDDDGGSIIGKFCGHPTPNLQELEIQIFSYLLGLGVFPETPSLKVFSSYGVFIPCFPDLTLAIEVDIGMNPGFAMALSKAVNVRKLKLKPTYASQLNQFHYRLVASYERLTTLHLSPGLDEGGFDKFSAPALRELSLNFTRESEFLEVASCKGIPFHQVKTILIEQKTPSRYSGIALPTYCEGLRHFLRVANSVEVLRVEDAIPQALVLKLLATDLSLLCQEPGVSLAVGGYNIKLEQGKDRLSSVTRVRDCMEGICDGTWDEIYEELARKWV